MPSCLSFQQPIMLTLGTGIGPELVALWLNTFTPPVPLHLVGQVAAMQPWLTRPLPAHVTCTALTGQPGHVAYNAIDYAVKAIASGQARGLLTGPISKQALWQAGYTQYGGHTEILQALANQHWPNTPPYQADMLFVHGPLRLMLLTRHVPLAQVGQTLTVTGVTQTLTGLVHWLQHHAGIACPAIALLGVNPHAGEIGGQEETQVLAPAREAVMAATGCTISKPLSADAFFRGFNAQAPQWDTVAACYHDQGLIPFKLLAGWQAVNVTTGLPFIRTSVSHGTADDLVGKGTVNTQSLQAAWDTLLQILAQHSTPCLP
jgi:4-hydroxy-L-threonine phosphate dehydrogenase PdxA